MSPFARCWCCTESFSLSSREDSGKRWGSELVAHGGEERRTLPRRRAQSLFLLWFISSHCPRTGPRVGTSHLSQSKLKILLGPDVHAHCLWRFWCIHHLLCVSLCDGDAGPKQATFHVEAGIPVLRRSPPGPGSDRSAHTADSHCYRVSTMYHTESGCWKSRCDRSRAPVEENLGAR